MQVGQVVLGQRREFDLSQVVRGEERHRAVLNPVFDAGEVVDHRVGVIRCVEESGGHQQPEYHCQSGDPEAIFTGQSLRSIGQSEWGAIVRPDSVNHTS